MRISNAGTEYEKHGCYDHDMGRSCDPMQDAANFALSEEVVDNQHFQLVHKGDFGPIMTPTTTMTTTTDTDTESSADDTDVMTSDFGRFETPVANFIGTIL